MSFGSNHSNTPANILSTSSSPSQLSQNASNASCDAFLSRIPQQPQSPHRMKSHRHIHSRSSKRDLFGATQARGRNLFNSPPDHSPSRAGIQNQSPSQQMPHSNHMTNNSSMNEDSPHASHFQFDKSHENCHASSVVDSPSNQNHIQSTPKKATQSSPSMTSPSKRSPSSTSKLSPATPPASPSSYCSRFIPSRQHSPFQVPKSPKSPSSLDHRKRRTKRKLQFESVSDTMRRRTNLDANSKDTMSTESHDQSSRDMYDDMLRREFWPDNGKLLRYETKRPTTSRTIESPQKVLRERLAMHSGEQQRSSLTKRKIATSPIKILDAPHLQDDFYLNLVDWGKNNILAVGLSHSVYLWNATTCKVVNLCTLEDGLISSVNFSQNGSMVAVGNKEGSVLLYDVAKQKEVRRMDGHTARVGCLSWNGNTLSSGSRDRTILSRDIRVPENNMNPLDGVIRLNAHKQEVCGLKWSPDGKELASGGNDNKLFVWHPTQKRTPMLRFSEHRAAVKGIAWSPHQHGLLASGGGTADRCIRFWNTTSGASLKCIDTGSQVCCLDWSKNSNEIVSTHGYSQNQIVVWKYPSMSSMATLTGHTFRVLYLSMSPDGQSIVTGAGDETLRLWNVFPPRGASSQSSPSMVSCIR